jgi:hypothetical protein
VRSGLKNSADRWSDQVVDWVNWKVGQIR